MSSATLEIVEPGLLTTVQDAGRYGYQRFGVPVSGAVDVFALRAANILAGNAQDAAGLEMTVVGPRVRFLDDTWIALTGADLGPLLDDRPIPMWGSVAVPTGAILSFDGARDGVRGYLAVTGGIDVPVVLGSRSTYVKGAIGGHLGRALMASDSLPTMERDGRLDPTNNRLPDHLGAPRYGNSHEIRVVLGPQDAAFTAEAVQTFLGSEYSVSIQSDRMGYRLEGPVIQHRSGPDLVSDGTPFGAVQVPGDGQPIILLSDRGTTGGYTKIATVISSDIGTLGQAMPVDTIRFAAVSVEEAHAIFRERERVLRDIEKAVRGADAEPVSIRIDGDVFEAVDDTGRLVSAPAVEGTVTSEATRHARVTVDGRTFEFDVEVQRAD